MFHLLRLRTCNQCDGPESRTALTLSWLIPRGVRFLTFNDERDRELIPTAGALHECTHMPEVGRPNAAPSASFRLPFVVKGW